MHRITIQYGAPADAEAFDAYYAETHVPLASTLPGLRRLVRSHPRGLGGEAPYFVAELWFDERLAIAEAGDSIASATTRMNPAAVPPSHTRWSKTKDI